MFFIEPPPNPYDLRFQVAGVPVRVHPWFWLITLLLGYYTDIEAAQLIIWCVAVLISILIHELGHVFAFRWYGVPSRVVIYSFGGLAIPERGIPRGTLPQVVVSLAGPAAGFLLGLIVLAVLKISGKDPFLQFGGKTLVSVGVGPFRPENLWWFAAVMLYINFFWGLINLLPIFPLDGGQVAQAVLSHNDPVEGRARSFMVSIFCAALLAVYAWVKLDQRILALMLAYLAYQNYTMLQAHRGSFGGRPW